MRLAEEQTHGLRSTRKLLLPAGCWQQPETIAPQMIFFVNNNPINTAYYKAQYQINRRTIIMSNEPHDLRNFSRIFQHYFLVNSTE
jgi:hypothetical protein